VELADHVNIKSFSIHGIENVITGPGNMLSFMYSGNINDLVGFLSGKEIINLMIEEPSLDEIFLHYYRS
jgi:ABC-2 type transport system ATP-binding protein